MMKQFCMALSLMWLSTKMVKKQKEKLESAANVVWRRLGEDGGCFPADWNALPERSACGVTFPWKVRG